jgi:hypothetical protein
MPGLKRFRPTRRAQNLQRTQKSHWSTLQVSPTRLFFLSLKLFWIMEHAFTSLFLYDPLISWQTSDTIFQELQGGAGFDDSTMFFNSIQTQIPTLEQLRIRKAITVTLRLRLRLLWGLILHTRVYGYDYGFGPYLHAPSITFEKQKIIERSKQDS